jgi:hypothetical protein
MDTLIHQWLSTLGDYLVKIKKNAESERIELVKMIEKSENTLTKIRNDFSHGNISIDERNGLISNENPIRIKINTLGEKYQSKLDQINEIERELNRVFEKRTEMGSDTDESFEEVMRNIDSLMTV